MEVSIIYYTANTEKPEFEAKVIENLKKQAGNIPIISVSRKPMDLGTNICIGEQDVCYSNSFKQLLIGLESAKTEFCIAAESDCLYPPEYFQFTPPTKDNVYRYTNVWIHFVGKGAFWRKSWSEGAQMCGREYWIESIKKVLEGHDGWNNEFLQTHQALKEVLPFIFRTDDKYFWTSENPVITFKTREGLSYKTGFSAGSKTSLPYWGDVDSLCEEVLK